MMRGKANINHSFVNPQNERDRLEGYVRIHGPEHSPVPSQDDCFVVILNETQPSLRPVRQIAIHRQHFRAQIAPMQAAGLSGYHMRPLGQFTSLRSEENVQVPLREIRNGQAYQLSSSGDRNLVTPEAAQALEKAFETFAARCGFTAQNPVSIELTRGYEAGDRGHGRGMAVDIKAVGGQSIAYWAQEFAKAVAQAKFIDDVSQRRSLMAQQTSSNLGYLLYRTLLEQGGWRIFNQVVQLFGPWTPRLGPWRRLQIDRSDQIQQRIQAEQEHIYRAHRDHIHVAFG